VEIIISRIAIEGFNLLFFEAMRLCKQGRCPSGAGRGYGLPQVSKFPFFIGIYTHIFSLRLYYILYSLRFFLIFFLE
jgi:hypothetical protein